MSDQRLLFSKSGRACYISHLDLMRTFQRAFLRAEVPIKHTEGFNPHAFVSIALPLSVGYSSDCELLDFVLLDGVKKEEVPARLNAVLPEGITIHQCYDGVQTIKKLTWLDWTVTLEYDNGVPTETKGKLNQLLSRDSMVIQKKSKKAKSGFTEVDIIPRIRSYALEEGEKALILRMVLSAQNPGLNPELVLTAFRQEYPGLTPDFVRCHRNEVLDGEGNVFR
jgi:radical SAM-linked protein